MHVDFLRRDGKVVRMKRKLAEHLELRNFGEIITAAPEPEVVASDKVRAEADALGIDLTEVEGSGKDGRILKRDLSGYNTRMLKAD